MHNTAKHTPGPWSAYYNNEGLTITNASNVTIAYVDYDECEERPVAANAALIAAAPAMYTLIKDMREAFYVNGTRKALLAVMERSHEIMAQAEGK